MNVSLAHIGVRLGLCLCLLSAAAPREANAQLSGLFQSVPGTLAAYQFQANGIQTVMLPVDLTLIFSNDNPTSMLTATILKPIIGAQADGTPIYPIAAFVSDAGHRNLAERPRLSWRFVRHPVSI